MNNILYIFIGKSYVYYCYIRVSLTKQSLEHQRFEIEQFVKVQGLTIDDWIEEKISSRKALNKRKLGALLDNLQENDILSLAKSSA